MTGADFSDSSDCRLHVRQNGLLTDLTYQVLAITSGTGVKALSNHLGVSDTSLPVRFWKSHLLLLRRIMNNPVFSLDPGSPAIMHHQFSSIVGLNEDAVPILEPSHSIDDYAVREIRNSLAKRYPHVKMNYAVAVACTKIDVALPTGGSTRSLSPTVLPLTENSVAILPGKMSEAPYIVDRVVGILSTRLGMNNVADRPCDEISDEGEDWESLKFANS